MRILHVLDHSLPLQSGYAFRTASILREQRGLGWETMHLTTPRQGATTSEVEEVSELLFHRTPLRRSAGSRVVPGLPYLEEMLATGRSLDALVRRFRPDVIHAHSPVLNALPALWNGRRHGIPVVYEVRALWEDGAVDHGSTREGSLRYRASRALESFTLRRADHVTTICEGLRQEIVARGVSSDQVTVIPNAVDTESFRPGAGPDAALRTRLGLDGATVVGFAGSFYRYEGLDLLIEALAMLAPNRPQLRALLIGGGPQDQALKTLAKERGVADRVRFTGRVPHSTVQQYYELVDVLVYPRHRVRLTELVTPLKPLEAMAQGRIVVASNVGGHRELIRDGETGFLFAAGQAPALAAKIDAVLESRNEWPQMRASARRFVESERTWPSSVARYAVVYGGLVERRQALAG